MFPSSRSNNLIFIFRKLLLNINGEEKSECSLFQSVYNLLGETLSRLQQFEEAERWYQAALQAQPDHVPAHITYGKLLAKNVIIYLINQYRFINFVNAYVSKTFGDTMTIIVVL